MKTILDRLEENAKLYPNKILFSDINESVTYKDFVLKSKKVASMLLKYSKQPVAVFDNRDVKSLIAMFAVLYSGNYYVVIDSASPADRINKIYQILNPVATIIEENNSQLLSEISNNSGSVLNIDNMIKNKLLSHDLDLRQKEIVSTDLAYVLFTSGSTGAPKGTVISHLNILNYIEWFTTEFDINPDTIFGNQTSFYFSMSVSDIYATVFKGATLNIIPRSYFTFLPQCVEFLNSRKVNTIYWVPSAMCLFANIKMLDYATLNYIKLVMFAGEVMPNKQLNYWRRHIPNAKYANLFGPTETTDICTFYIVNREFKDDEPLPIGVHCNNCDTFLIDDNGNLVTEKNTLGELYVRGPFLSKGYFNNPDKTNNVFVQNPLNKNYPEIVYKTGDLVRINDFGEYEYAGRKDFQIKHKGYRIELGEIENAVYGIEKIDSAVCLFDRNSDEIVLMYVGKVKDDAVRIELQSKVPAYMLPEVVIKVANLPYNANGKVDRNWLLQNYKQYLTND